MSEPGPYVPPEGLPSDLVFREARVIVDEEVRRIQEASRAVRLSADTVLLIRDTSYTDLAASVDSIGKEPDGPQPEMVAPAKTTNILTLGAVIIGGTFVNSLLDGLLGRGPKNQPDLPH